MKVLSFAWHSLWRRRPRGPVTLVGAGADWPTETQAGDMALLVVEATEPPTMEGWELVRMAPGVAMYYRIVGWVRHTLRLPEPARARVFVFRNATLSRD